MHLVKNVKLVWNSICAQWGLNMAPVPKALSLGNYRLEGVTLGKGTFGRVELASHLVLKAQVALKITFPRHVNDEYVEKHLHREAQILSNLDHPNIVRLLEICSTPHVHCLVMEYVSGGTLLDLIQAEKCVAEEEARPMAKQLASAVNYLHEQNIIHRDLKLENILLDRQKRVVLIDFGLSNTCLPDHLALTHCGSAEYAAPELFAEGQTYGAPVDIWSFGVIMYAILVGTLPFQRGPISEDPQAEDRVHAEFVKRINRGIVDRHHQRMKHLSSGAKSLILGCLKVDDTHRLAMNAALKSRWLSIETRLWTTKRTHPVEEIAKDLKLRLNIKLSTQEVLDYVQRRPFGTTAGCFNILTLKYIKFVDESVRGRGCHSLPRVHTQGTAEVDRHLGSVSYVSKGDAGGNKENGAPRRAPPIPALWRRSPLRKRSSGRLSFPRLKRVDMGEEEQRSSLKDLGQRALNDISNALMGPLMRRRSGTFNPPQPRLEPLKPPNPPVKPNLLANLPEGVLQKKLRKKELKAQTTVGRTTKKSLR